MSERRINGFFYGQFMDVTVLRTAALCPPIRALRMLMTSHCASATVPR
jgi:hypothetical protein